MQGNCVWCLGGFFTCHKIFYHYYFLSYFVMTRKKIAWTAYFAIPFYWIRYIPNAFHGLYFLPRNMFYFFWLSFYCMFFRVLSSLWLICLSKIFYQIIFSVKLNLLTLHFYFANVTFSLYHICIRYLGRTRLLCLNNIFLCYNLIYWCFRYVSMKT